MVNKRTNTPKSMGLCHVYIVNELHEINMKTTCQQINKNIVSEKNKEKNKEEEKILAQIVGRGGGF